MPKFSYLDDWAFVDSLLNILLENDLSEMAAGKQKFTITALKHTNYDICQKISSHG